MFERIKEKLEQLGCAGWELTEKTVKSWEFYFIRHALDQNRAVETTVYEIKVYKDLEDGQFLGSASGVLSPTSTEEDTEKLLKDLLFRAGYVRNPAYRLQDRILDEAESVSEEPIDPAAISTAFLQAMQSVEETENEDVNSYEIFVREIRRRFLNSNGVSSFSVYPDSMAEVVINARRDGKEIEIYRNFTSGTCDGEKLKKDVQRAMQVGRDRLAAVPTPKCLAGLDVVFTGSNAVSLYEYFVDRMSASFRVHKLSDWEIGQQIAPENKGDAITIRALPTLPNSSKNFTVDAEGSRILERTLIEKGEARSYWGSRQMSQYLGLEESSIIYNIAVDGGSLCAGQLQEGDYLEAVEFSDFQVDPVGGDIAGEIRLAYWHHGGEITPVTGGSISGTMTEALKNFRFSAETEQYDTYVIPALTRASGLRITGVE